MSKNIKISLITAVYNRRSTISDAIESVIRQQSADIEYIVVDGMSNDGTDTVVDKFASHIHRSIREPDDGIYDALNKGIAVASGDVIGFLHADDMLAGDHVLDSISRRFADPSVDAVYGDLLYVQPENSDPIVRFWKSGNYDREKFRYGWMPPHPTVYIRKSHYDKLGSYRTDFSISADYELLIRMFYKNALSLSYIDQVLVRMRVGGKSNASLQNRILANREDGLAWEVNDLKPPLGLRFTKPIRKLSQYWTRPKTAKLGAE